MAAANTDKFKKVARKWVGQIGAGGVADNAVTTVPLASATNLPTDTAVEVVIDRVDANGTKTPTLEETVTGVVSGDNLTSCIRGAEGTAQAHAAGAVVEVLITATTWNDFVDGFVAEHDQAGAHGALTATSLTMNAGKIDLDLDDDTSIHADTDDQIDFEVGGTDAFVMKAADLDLGGTTPNITVGAADPWRTITLMPGLLKPTTTAGCASSTTVEAGTNDIDYDVLDFDTITDENAFANFHMPDSWDAGNVQFRYIWTNAGGGAAETVTFELSGRSFADNDAIDQAVTSPAIEVADTWIAQGDVHISAWSANVTLAGTPAAGELVHVEVMRDISEDDLTGDARLMAVQIRYKQGQFTD